MIHPQTVTSPHLYEAKPVQQEKSVVEEPVVQEPVVEEPVVEEPEWLKE